MKQLPVLALAPLLAATIAAPCLMQGCAATPDAGYAAASPYPSRYRSVALPIFRILFFSSIVFCHVQKGTSRLM